MQTTNPIHLREIGGVIQKQLEKSPEHDVHWVTVTGENSMDNEPTRVWTDELANCLLQVAVRQGNSEGMLLYVQALPNRYEPDRLETLFTIKLLCGHDQSHLAARDLGRFLNSSEFESLVAGRAAKEQDNSRRIYRPATPSPESQRLALAQRFMQELLNSVETIGAIAQTHGSDTVADLLYLHAAIASGESIDSWDGASGGVQDVVDALPSRSIWSQHIKLRDACQRETQRVG